MKTSTLLTGLLLTASGLTAPTTENEKRQNQFISINGVPNNGNQVRVELRTMQQKNPTMYALYLLGLQEFKKMSQNDPLSYYQIAGIHGRPYTPWNGNTFGSDGNGFGGGYCTHVSNLFLPWHRPYLALYEQQLYIHVQNVAKKYSTNAQNIAKNFRIPYWDWAAAPCSTCAYMPKLVTDQYSVITIDGKQINLENPLFRYTFTDTAAQRRQAFYFDPFSTWGFSKRYPTSSPQDGNMLAPYGISQNNLINAQMQSAQASLQSRVYTLLTSYDNFTQFSNEAWLQGGSQGGKSDSLESVHDAIHGITGGGGSMTYLDYSAFDPVFWLHHANVDRLFALWQALHGGNSYVQPEAQPNNNFFYQQGQIQDVNSYLAPFHSSAGGNQWTSANSRDVTAFKYTYPELVSGKSMTSQINALYNPGTGSNSNSNQAQKAKKAKKVKKVKKAKKAKKAKKGKRDTGSTYQYVANILSQKYQLQGSYRIHVFIGEVPDAIVEWTQPDSNLVGTQYVLANLNASASTDMKITGSVPMSFALEALVAAGEIDSMDPDDVEPFLEANLSWRVVKADGTEVPVRELTDLSITVATATYIPPASIDKMPIWGPWESLKNCTSGQPGGHDDAYWDLPAHQMGGKYTFADYVKAGMS